MRKVIKGRLYDTETARLVCDWSNEYYANDLRWCAETLYRKRTGEYFVHGEGSALSKYARGCGGNATCGGEAITPLTYEQAREWAEAHMETEDYEAEFGTPDEGDRYDLHASISVAAQRALSRAAAAEGVTVGAIIERLASTL